MTDHDWPRLTATDRDWPRLTTSDHEWPRMRLHQKMSGMLLWYHQEVSARSFHQIMTWPVTKHIRLFTGVVIKVWSTGCAFTIRFFSFTNIGCWNLLFFYASYVILWKVRKSEQFLCGISHTLSLCLFICPREQSVCHVVSTWRVDWVPLPKGWVFLCGDH